MKTITLLQPLRGTTRSALDNALRAGVRAVYQPIVELQTGNVVGYEALARGPAGSELESPLALFAAARIAGRVAELDWACRLAAVQGALDAGLSAPAALFINAEPEVLAASPDPRGRELILAAAEKLQLCFEITERAMTLHPAELLATVERIRAAGFAIALDDVGADRRSLALLPILRPDIVKLDISLIHDHPSRSSGEVMNGVCAYAEQTGAAVVAEGIENEGHLLAARSLGATLAQGWHFGRPGPLPTRLHVVSATRRLGVTPRRPPRSPVALVHARRGVTVGRKDVLLSVSKALEAQALELGEHAIVVSTFQDVRYFTPPTVARYTRLGASAALVAALGVGMDAEPAVGVRGACLDPDDALRGEWDIAVLGPHYAGALVARDLGDGGPDRERRFEFVLTFDRELVIEVAATLISRVRGPATAQPALAA